MYVFLTTASKCCHAAESVQILDDLCDQEDSSQNNNKGISDILHPVINYNPVIVC